MEKTIGIMFSCVSCSEFKEDTVGRNRNGSDQRGSHGNGSDSNSDRDRIEGCENGAFVRKIEFRRTKSEMISRSTCISEETAQRMIKLRISKYYERSKLHDSRKQVHKEKLEKLHNRTMEKL